MGADVVNRKFPEPGADDQAAEFISAASVPRGTSHGEGTLERAEAIRAAHPAVGDASIYAAAVLGDEAAIRKMLAADPASATRAGGPYGWDPLTYLCFSRYLRLDPTRGEGFVRAATALLDAGASANTGWRERDGEWESVLYGAAGIAHHAGLTRLLLERGADPNDEETPYHAPEGHETDVVQALLDSGRLSADNLATMLLRKADWHHTEGIRQLLGAGVDPNRMTRWGRTALQQALERDNAWQAIDLLLEHGADPRLPDAHGTSSIAIAARRGRGEVLDLFQRRGVDVGLRGLDAILAACALGDVESARRLADADTAARAELLSTGGTVLGRFAGVGNAAGVRALLDLGIPVDARFEQGDGYFATAPRSTALHVAAWRAYPHVVAQLIERGADVHAVDGWGRTALQLAVRACVDSYWAFRRTPDSVALLLRAGASRGDITAPTGYAAIDELLGLATA